MIINRTIGFTLGLALLIGCSTNNKSPELRIKDYYFPYKDFFEPKTYCYANANDTADKVYWIMQTKIEGKDTLFFTNIFDSQRRLTEELVEKIINKGSRMLKYTLYQSDSNNRPISAPCQVIDSVIFNWNQNIGESVVWKIVYPEFVSGKTIESIKTRTLIGIDSLKSVAIFKDNNSQKMIGSLVSNDYEIEFHYQKGIGAINYILSASNGFYKDYRLIKK